MVLHMTPRKRETEIMFRLTVRVPETLAERLKIRAVKERRTLQELVTEAIEALLKTPLKAKGGES
jgi:hypothetical protein